MADNQPEIKPAEIIGFHEGQQLADLSSLPDAGFRSGVESARRLREQQAKSQSQREVIVEAKRSSEVKIEKSQVDDMKSMFGAGLTKLDNTGNVMLDEDKLVKRSESERTLIRESFRSGEKALQGIVNYLTYADVITEANASKKNPVDVLKRENPRADTAAWEAIKNNAITTLIDSGAIQKIYPEFSSLPNATQKEIMGKMIASDPELRKKVSRIFRDRENELLNLPPFESDADLNAAKEAKKSSEVKKDEKVESVIQQIGDLGLSLDEAELKNEIKRRIDEGKSAENIAGYIQEKLLKEDSDYALIISYPQLKQEYDAALAANKGANASNNTQEYKDARKKELDEATRRYEEVNAKITAMGDALYRDKFKKVQAIAGLTNVTKDTGGSYASQLLQDLGEAAKAKKDLAQAEKTIKEKEEEGTKKTEQSLRRRLRKEGEIVTALEDDLHNAILDVLAERTDTVSGLKAKEQAENTTKDEAEALKKVEEAMKNNWISYERGKRGKQVHKEQISRDMKVIAYEGDDGIKRLILRDMGVGSWESMDLASLPDNVKSQLNAAYTQHREKYRDTLLKDYFLARSEGGGRVLNLKEHEWELLEQNFGGELEKALKSSETAQGVLQSLKEKGIVPTRSFKWLLYALLAAGAVGVGFALGPSVVGSGGAKGALSKLGALGIGH